MQRREASGFELFRFLCDHGFRVCEAVGGDIDNVVMARDCDNVGAGDYIGVPVRQPRLAASYLQFTLKKAGFTLDYFWEKIERA